MIGQPAFGLFRYDARDAHTFSPSSRSKTSCQAFQKTYKKNKLPVFDNESTNTCRLYNYTKCPFEKQAPFAQSIA